MAHYIGEVLTGATKTCYYEYMASVYSLTQSAVELCPLTIQVVFTF